MRVSVCEHARACVSVSAAKTPTRSHLPPAEEGDLYRAPRCFRSFRVSHQPDLSCPHPRPCPLHPLHRKWAGPGVFVCAGLLSQLLPGLPELEGVRAGLRGRWQRRDPERAHCGPMSQPGDFALTLPLPGSQRPGVSLPALPAAWGWKRRSRDSFQLSSPRCPRRFRWNFHLPALLAPNLISKSLQDEAGPDQGFGFEEKAGP